MVDFSQWDFAEQFTPKEAAALIAGIEPTTTLGGGPIETRIGEATVKTFIAVMRGEPPPPDGLLTRELALTMGPDFAPSIFLDATGSTLHGIETLDRAEIVRWLSALGAKSVYQFAPAQTAETPAPVVAKYEPKEQRQDRRLGACETAGLVMPDSYRGRLPDGVGRVAATEGVTRQTFSADVKAVLKRRGRANGQRLIVRKG